MKWTHEQLEALPEAAKKRNPHLFQSVAGLGNPQRERPAKETLDRPSPIQTRSKSGVVIIVEIVSFRRKRLDDDNLIAGAKCIRDTIARSLAIDDGDRRIQWRYHQIDTKGKPGTFITVTAL